MSKVRIYHLAAEWEVSSYELMTALESVNSSFTSHFMEVDEHQLPKLRSELEASGLFGTPEPEPEPEVIEAEVEVEAVPEEAEGAVAEAEAEVSPAAEAPAAPVAETRAPPASRTRERPPVSPRDSRDSRDSRDGRGGRDSRESRDPGRRPDRRPTRSGPGQSEEPAPLKVGGRDPSKGKSKIKSKAKTKETGKARDAKRKGSRGGSGGSSSPESPSYNPQEELQLSLENSSSDGDAVVIRRTMPGAMSHGGGGSAARRRSARLRERARWRGRSRGGRRGRRYRSQSVTRPSEVRVKLPINLKELSAATGIKLNDLIMRLMKHGIMMNQNQPVPPDIILKVSHEFLVDIHISEDTELEDNLVDIEKQSERSDEEDLEPRRPVVTIMGHVDHGKTTLLDYIRETRAPVAGTEAGGITQHIGAYVAEYNGKPITFIDTPGHAAFTKMRSRGASVTDICVLVVAADDGVKAQTQEAIAHARAAGVEIIVALNKIDKDNADPEKAMQDLTTEGLQPAEWGGETEVIPVSAVTGAGVDELLETITTVADLLELRANPTGPAFGYVLEGKRTQGRGIVASVLIVDGTLNRRDWIIAGESTGRVRMLFSDSGKPLKDAGPGVPVEILGLDEVPKPGDKLYSVDEDDAKALQDKRQRARSKEEQAASSPLVSRHDVFETLEQQKAKRIPIILRTDVQGSLEVLKAEIPALSNEEVVLEITQALIGRVTENDIFLAQAQGGLVVAFNVDVDSKANDLAKEQEVEISRFSVIYELIDDLTQRIEDALDPEIKEEHLGKLVCRATFKASRIGQVAGCYVDSGVARRGSMARLARDEVIIWEGEIDSVKRFKDDVKEVREGFECGVKLKGFNDVRVGDVIEVFEIQKIKRTLERN